MSWEEFEARVRAGRIPPDTPVRIEAVTGQAFVAAKELELYRSMRNEAALAYEDRFLSGPPPIATALLVGLQIRIWWFAQVEPFEELLVGIGVNFAPPVFDDGQIWRPLTMGILHTDLLHIGLNMMWLAYVGWNLERALGWANLIAIYVASVLGGALLSMFISPFTPSLGASGGVFGLIAASVVFGFARREVMPLQGQRWFGLAMLPYLVVMFLSGWMNEQTDNWAHAGGLITGALLGLMVEPDEIAARPGRPRWVRIGVGVTVLAALAGLWVLGPRLHPLFDSDQARALSRPRLERPRVRTEAPARPLRWEVPGGWRPGSDVLKNPAFVSPDGKRAFSVVERSRDRARPLADAAVEWADKVRKDFPQAEVGQPQHVPLAGREGLMLTAVVGEGSERRKLTWWGASRGITEIHVTWQVDPARERRLAPLRDRLVARVHRGDPSELLVARQAHDANPGSYRTRMALAAELAKVGEAEEAIALHEQLVADAEKQGPSVRAERWVAYLTSLRMLGPQAGPVEPKIERALADAPTPQLLVAAADTLDAIARPELASGLLTIAWWATPGDSALKRARVRRDLPVQLYGAEPWELAHDPVGRPRSAREIAQRTAWKPTLADAEEAARALQSDRRASITAAADGISRGSLDAVAPLLILRQGWVPEPPSLEDAKKALADELDRALAGRGPDWVPVEVAGALTERPDYPATVRGGSQGQDGPSGG